jgi:DNA-binding MarR family transcriptional regulator
MNVKPTYKIREGSRTQSTEKPLISDKALDWENILSHRMTRVIWRIYNYGDRGDIGGMKMSLREWRVLAALGLNGRLTISGMSEFSGVSHTVISRAVKSLSKKGCVETRKSSRDKRQTLVQLTDEGLRIHDIIATRRKKFLTEIQLGLSAEEQATFFSLVDKLERHIQLINQDEGDGWD